MINILMNDKIKRKKKSEEAYIISALLIMVINRFNPLT